jgi:hypothetical protein
MHKRPESKSTHSPGVLRGLLLAGLSLAMVAAPPLLRSQTMSASPKPSAPELSIHERLMQLVPEHVGDWKRQTLNRARPGMRGVRPSTVLAEFRRGDERVQMSVGQTKGEPKPVPVLDAPVERNSAEGSEKSYTEGAAMVMESFRRADGRTEVSLVRADGIVVSVQSIGVAASELKALVQGIKAFVR